MRGLSYSNTLKSVSVNTPSQRDFQAVKSSALRLLALANRPRIILADEPTAPLDSARARIVMDMLRRIAADQRAWRMSFARQDREASTKSR